MLSVSFRERKYIIELHHRDRDNYFYFSISSGVTQLLPCIQCFREMYTRFNIFLSIFWLSTTVLSFSINIVLMLSILLTFCCSMVLVDFIRIPQDHLTGTGTIKRIHKEPHRHTHSDTHRQTDRPTDTGRQTQTHIYIYITTVNMCWMKVTKLTIYHCTYFMTYNQLNSMHKNIVNLKSDHNHPCRKIS